MTFERARSKEQIKERKKEIIKACAILFDQSGYDGVHFKAIGEITSFTRSTIYNYYQSKEEILLDLLLEDMKKWDNDIKELMTAAESLSKEGYCQAITDIFLQNDRMMRLLSILFSSLEENSSLEKLADFKKDMSQLNAYAKSVYHYFPDVSDEKKQLFIMTSTTLLLGLYPYSHLSEKQKKAIELSGSNFVPPDFKDLCYKGMFMLLSDF